MTKTTLSKTQRFYNLFYRLFIKPLNLLDGRSQIKRAVVNYGGYILAKRSASMVFEKTMLNNKPATKCSDGAITSQKVIFYIHGGGFGAGGPMSHQHIAARLAGLLNGVAYLPTYPLAPEHPFPAAINCLQKTYVSLLQDGHKPSDIIFAGDSAGGNLCTTLIHVLETHGNPLPSGVILFSPSLDHRFENETHLKNARSDLMISSKLNITLRNNYLQGHDPSDPLISPLLAEYRNPPPFLIFASENEVYLGCNIDFTNKFKAAGFDITLITEPDLPHVWQFLWGRSAEADKSIAQCRAFMRRISQL